MGRFSRGTAWEYVEGLKDPRLRDIAMAEYHYFSGRPEEAAEVAELYLSYPEQSLRLSACLIYAYANLSIRPDPADPIHHGPGTADAGRRQHPHPAPSCGRLAVFTVTAAAVLLHLPLPEEVGPLQEQLRLLPPGLRLFGLYVQAHHTYLLGDYGKSIGIVETAPLPMQAEVYPIPNIYLHLVAVMDYMSLKQPEQAERHLLAAWALAQPDDLIEGFGEQSRPAGRDAGGGAEKGLAGGF